MVGHNLILWLDINLIKGEKVKKVIIILSALFFSSISYGETIKSMSSDKKIESVKNIKKIKVHGMACPLCQSKAEKKFKEISSVNSVDVDMEKMLITLNLKKGTDLSTEKIKPIVTSLGLTFVKVVK